MKLTAIGVYGPYPKTGESTSCYLVECENLKFTLDFGSGALSKIGSYIDPGELDFIALSHLHFDHFCDVLPFSYMTKKSFKIYAPAAPTDCFSLIKNRKVLDIGVIADGSVVHAGGVTLEFMSVTHPVESYAVKVTDKSGKFFVYTGDTSETGRLPELAKGAQFIICDCAGEQGSPHLTPEEGAMLQKMSGSRVIVSHLNPGYDISARAQKLGLHVISPGEVFEF